MKITIKSIGSYPHGHRLFVDDTSLGIKQNQRYLGTFDVVDKKVFSLSVVKYGIVYREVKNS
jgi:hypothetical protein